MVGFPKDGHIFYYLHTTYMYDITGNSSNSKHSLSKCHQRENIHESFILKL